MMMIIIIMMMMLIMITMVMMMVMALMTMMMPMMLMPMVINDADAICVMPEMMNCRLYKLHRQHPRMAGCSGTESERERERDSSYRSHFGSSREWFKDVGCRSAPLSFLFSPCYQAPFCPQTGAPFPCLSACLSFAIAERRPGQVCAPRALRFSGRPGCATQLFGDPSSSGSLSTAT